MCSNIPGFSQLVSLFTEEKNSPSEESSKNASSKNEKVENVAKVSLNALQKDSQELVLRTQHKSVRGLPNVGNSCYVNAVIQLLANSPAFLEKLIKTKEAHTATDEFQKYFFEFVTKLHSEKVKTTALAKGDAKGFVDKLVQLGWTTQSKKRAQRDAYDFMSFLMQKAALSHVFYGITAKEVEAIKESQLATLLHNVQNKRKKNPFDEQDEAPDFVLVTVEGRFVEKDGQKKNVTIEPSSIIELGKEKKIPYVLSGVIVNPSLSARSGHYIAYVPKQLQDETAWIKYDDNYVTPIAALDKNNKELIEQHSYLYLFQKVTES